MKTALCIISFLGLLLTVIAPLLLWAGQLDIATNRILLNIGMILWFGTAVFWVKQHEDA